MDNTATYRNICIDCSLNKICEIYNRFSNNIIKIGNCQYFKSIFDNCITPKTTVVQYRDKNIDLKQFYPQEIKADFLHEGICPICHCHSDSLMKCSQCESLVCPECIEFDINLNKDICSNCEKEM